ncbi:MAG: large subunit ribosomal protein L23 [Parcubacteria group bacterium Gr01-1014_2]|nr:MAG: large subunit ribosomal protein L23 [Parcubacteria group bacterium Gr01-1014_2]
MALFKRNNKEEIKSEQKKETKEEMAKLGLPEGKDPKLYKIVEKPIVTEKAVNLSKGNKYVFRVFPKTNKVEVKKAIEKLYEVKVKNIRIINTVPKKRQVGRFEGWRPGFKKAIITLEKGYRIEISHS